MRRAILVPLILIAACSHAVEAKRERVELAPPAKPTTSPQQDIADSRAGVGRILSDVRDAWTWPIGEKVVIEVPACRGFEVFECAFGVSGPRTPSIPAKAGVHFEIVVPGVDRAPLTDAAGLDALMSAWRGVKMEPPSQTGAARLTLSASWDGPPPANAVDFRAAFAIPPHALGRPRAADTAPNVVIISIDTLRADRLGCYGYSRKTTPHIDALAAQGTLFENAMSAAPWTLPSYGTFFTSRLPSEHRAGIVTEREESWGKDEPAPAKITTELLRPDLPTMAGLFAHAGWSTFGFHANPYLGAGSGIGRGFDRYVRYETNAHVGIGLSIDVVMGAQPPDSRYLLFIHLMDPHWPYAPPAPFDERFAGKSIASLPDWPPSLDDLRVHEPDAATKKLLSDLYDGEIAFADNEIETLLSWLDTKDNGKTRETIVILHSDHGEEFWEHGGCDHGHSQNAELLHIPLIIRWPGHVPAGKRVATRVRTLDVLPTLLELCGIPAPDSLEGSSLVPLWNDKDLVDRDALSEAVQRGTREIKALASGTTKLIASGASGNRLFDLTTDPIDMHDTSAANAARVAELRARIALQHEKAAKIAKQPAIPIDALDAEALRKLGYTGVVAPPK